MNDRRELREMGVSGFFFYMPIVNGMVKYSQDLLRRYVHQQEGQHPLTGQRAPPISVGAGLIGDLGL